MIKGINNKINTHTGTYMRMRTSRVQSPKLPLQLGSRARLSLLKGPWNLKIAF